MSVKCWANVASAGQYAFSPRQYFMPTVPARWRYGHDALNQSWVNVNVCDAGHIQSGAKHNTVTQYCANGGSASWTVGQH